MQKRKRRLGDRYDGYRLRNVDPFFHLVPHVMPARSGSQVAFDERFSIGAAEKLVRKLKSEGAEVSMLHLVLAGIVRVMSQKPRINRFVAGGKLYARNSISLSFAIKRGMSEDAEESTIKTIFEPEDTFADVAAKINAEYNASAAQGSKNSTDKTAKILSRLPSFLLRFVVKCVKGLDSIGLMPKAINRVSPFHCSAFITDVGSLGLGPVYHHLYDFGSCSVFIALGRKETVHSHEPDGTISTKRYINLRFMVDERICEGYDYATAIRMFRKVMQNPEQLLSPPEKVAVDDK